MSHQWTLFIISFILILLVVIIGGIVGLKNSSKSSNKSKVEDCSCQSEYGYKCEECLKDE